MTPQQKEHLIKELEKAREYAYIDETMNTNKFVKEFFRGKVKAYDNAIKLVKS